MKKSLQLVGTSVGLGLGVALSACAAQDSEPMPAWTPAGHGKALVTDDACSPSRIVSSSKDPFSTCATSTQYTVPNLALAPGATTPGGDLGTQSFGDDDGLGLLDVNGPPMRASCNGKVGPGYDTCGVDHKQSCCSVASVPDARPSGYPVAGFDLDVYEVTSGRFESFVAATGGNLRDAAAQGKWPGWKPEWTEQLPASRADVDDQLGPSCKARSALDEYGALTWPADRIVQSVNGYMVDDNERAADIRADATPDRLHQKPINCVTYYVAAAFCAWDGGRLPTNTEWGYVAQGGAEKRAYPWGADVTAANAVTDLKPPPDSGFFTFPDGFSYNDLGMNAYHIAPPGSKPAGRGKWGHEDLGGNLLEWTADVVGTSGLVRGGSWEGHSMSNAVAFANYPLDRSYGSLGIRCAYGAAPAASVALPEPTTTVSVYRAHDAANDAYQQGAQVDLAAPGYELQGMSFRVQVPTVAAPNSYPLHRCLVPGSRDYFLSNDPACEGQQHLGLLGYAYADQQLGTLPLYRCYGGKGTHLSTVTPVECTEEGLQLEGLQGYVVPPPPGTFVRNTYKTALAREPENDGYVAWMNGFRVNGCNVASLAAFSTAALLSPEFESFGLDNTERVKRLYLAVLEREADFGGLTYYVGLLDAGTTNWHDLVTSFVTVPEATALAPKRCENVPGGGTDGPGQGGGNADSCAKLADGWYCSDVNPGAGYHCMGNSFAGAAECAAGQTCQRDGAKAKMQGDTPLCQ